MNGSPNAIREIARDAAEKGQRRRRARSVAIAVVVLVVVVLAALSTKVVTGSGATDPAPGAFSADGWAEDHYDEITSGIADKAVDIAVLAQAIQADPAAAAKQYGAIEGGNAPVYSVRFTGVIGDAQNNSAAVTVDGMPPGVSVFVQLGPAINGVAIRDATGSVHFGQFKNQIDYQNISTSLNNEIKKRVLAEVAGKSLSGKTATITGAFQLITPNSLLVTPTRIELAP